MPLFSLDYKAYSWTDLDPIPQNDGRNPIAPIAYSEQFKETMGLLRACMKKEEYSDRALALTGAVIDQNPAHYTVWEYRYQILKRIGKSLIPADQWFVADVEPPVVEIGTWLDDTCLDSPKNYQVWNYRQHLEVPGSLAFYRGEHAFVAIVLDDDSKNFHAWSHLKWTVRKGREYFTTAEELKFSEQFLEEDIRNNSAWSYRYFVFDNDPKKPLTNSDRFREEVEFVQGKIDLAPQNESAWNYLRGLYSKYEKDIGDLEGLCLQYASVSGELPEINSMYALELLEDIYVKQGKVELADEALTRLENLVPMRKGYWNYKRRKLQT
jgi:protein farnesyltransferase/geranylgeranyltransferase type-1 subunit alpha